MARPRLTGTAGRAVLARFVLRFDYSDGRTYVLSIAFVLI